ncbi:MAG: hypothetical protein ACSHYF_14240 [Verrucomicrobiaceae bacterium]
MMNLSDDLPPHWIWIKAAAFLLILSLSAALTLFLTTPLQRLFPLFCVIWSSARLYYFAFYVIEHYLDPNFRFSGLFSLARLLKNRKVPPK